MRFAVLPTVIASLCLLAAASLAAPASRSFSFDPQPRWVEDPESEEVCKAILAECAALLKDGEIETSWSYSELYDSGGYLVGIRTLKSTGCQPLDDHMLLSHRHFRSMFAHDGQPDLEGIRVELKPGTPADAVRLVKSGETQVSMGC